MDFEDKILLTSASIVSYVCSYFCYQCGNEVFNPTIENRVKRQNAQGYLMYANGLFAAAIGTVAVKRIIEKTLT